jgi:hypothetical protein
MGPEVPPLHLRPCSRNPFTTHSHKTSGLSSPVFASSIILLAITSLVGSPRSASPRARRVISNARPMIRLVSGSNLELPKNCEIGMGNFPRYNEPATAVCARGPGRCTGGCCTAGTGRFRTDVRKPPNGYVGRCSSEVQSAPSMDDAPACGNWRGAAHSRRQLLATAATRTRASPHSRVPHDVSGRCGRSPTSRGDPAAKPGARKMPPSWRCSKAAPYASPSQMQEAPRAAKP